MRRVCAWCKKEMGTKEDNSGNDIVTHGICPECEKLLKYDPVITKDLLNEFEEPVLLLDVDVRCLVANSSASKALDKKLTQLRAVLAEMLFVVCTLKSPVDAVKLSIVPAVQSGILLKIHLKQEEDI